MRHSALINRCLGYYELIYFVDIRKPDNSETTIVELYIHLCFSHGEIHLLRLICSHIILAA